MHTESQPYLLEFSKCRLRPSVFFHNCLQNLQLGFGWMGVTVTKAFKVLHIIYYIPTFHQRFYLVYLYVASQNTYDVMMRPDCHMLLNLPFWRWMTDIKNDPTDRGCNDKWWLELSLECPRAEHMVSTVRWFSQKVNHNTRPLTKTWEM